MKSELTTPLIVHTDWSRSWGGQEIRILTELREMRHQGFRVALIVPSGAELARRAQAEEIPVYEVKAFAKLSLPSWIALFRLLRQLKPTVLNTHSSEDSWMAGALGRILNVPLILRTRHVLAPISSSVSYNCFPHVILTCSEAIAQQLITQGVRPEKLVVASTGNDEQQFSFSAAHRQQIRQQYGIGEKEFLVGNVGFLRNYKGHAFILRTLARLPEQYRCMLVGDGRERSSLQALAEELGISHRVIFIGHQEQVAPYFSAFDLLFFSSYEVEGISQALIQGLLNGLPVLACAIASTTEAVSLIESYRLVAYNDLETASEKIQELARGSLRDATMMERQHRIIAERYGVAAMMRILLNIYRKQGVTPHIQFTESLQPSLHLEQRR